MNYSALALGFFLVSSPAHAVVACNAGVVIGNACTQLGATEMSSDCTGVAGCFFSDPTQTAKVWKASYSGGGDGGGYIVQGGSCAQANPLALGAGGGCVCPTGYTAAPTSESPAVTFSGITTPGYIGYTCYPSSAAATAAPPPTRWVSDGQGEQASCAANALGGATSTVTPSYCTSTPQTLPCTVGQTAQRVVQCTWGNWSDCPTFNGLSQGWSVLFYNYQCESYVQYPPAP
jgi:hypothetical protein